MHSTMKCKSPSVAAFGFTHPSPRRCRTWSQGEAPSLTASSLSTSSMLPRPPVTRHAVLNRSNALSRAPQAMKVGIFF
jgi:hypothetical protein